MAFAPRGSRPKIDGSSNKPVSKLADERQPAMIIGLNIEPKSRERVNRKPPLPRGLIRSVRPSNSSQSATTSKSRAATARHAEPKLEPGPSKRLLPTKPTVTNTSRNNTTTTLKPRLPPRLKPAQVAPSALSITAQLAPWVFMRSSLEQPLQQLEAEAEETLRERKNEVERMEKRVEEDQKRLELVEETELLEDLCHPLNVSFTSSVFEMTQRLSLFLCPTSRVTERLEDVQKQVHSIKLEEKYEEMRIDTEKEMAQGQALQRSLAEIQDLIPQCPWEGSREDTQARLMLKYPDRWRTLFSRYASLLDARLQNLQRLGETLSFIEEYRKRRAEGEVLKMALESASDSSRD